LLDGVLIPREIAPPDIRYERALLENDYPVSVAQRIGDIMTND